MKRVFDILFSPICANAGGTAPAAIMVPAAAVKRRRDRPFFLTGAFPCSLKTIPCCGEEIPCSRRKIPCSDQREFTTKLGDLLTFSGPSRPEAARFREIPCYFPVTRELGGLDRDRRRRAVSSPCGPSRRHPTTDRSRAGARGFPRSPAPGRGCRLAPS